VLYCFIDVECFEEKELQKNESREFLKNYSSKFGILCEEK